MTRIRYTKQDNDLISQYILVNNTFVYVLLDPNLLVYEIWKTNDSNSDNVLKEGQAESLAKLKAKAKQALKELGASFSDEIRNRGKTEKLKFD